MFDTIACETLRTPSPSAMPPTLHVLEADAAKTRRNSTHRLARAIIGSNEIDGGESTR